MPKKAKQTTKAKKSKDQGGTSSSARKAKLKPIGVLDADASGMVGVDGREMPLPDRSSATIGDYYQRLQAAHYHGFDGEGRTELLRIEQALDTYIKEVERLSGTRQRPHTDQMHVEDLARTRMSQFASDALTQLQGLRQELDLLADTHPGVKIYYQGNEMKAKKDGSYERCFDDLIQSQQQLDPNGVETCELKTCELQRCLLKTYVLTLQGLRSGLILSRMALWMYMPTAHMESDRKHNQGRHAAESAYLNKAQEDAVRSRYNELLKMMKGAKEAAVYKAVHQELTEIRDSGADYVSGPIRQVPGVSTLKGIINRTVPSSPDPEGDLFRALWLDLF